jgi:colicin import membrane protein
MKKIISGLPLMLLIVALLAWGNTATGQQKENRGKASKEMKQEAMQQKQKGKEEAGEIEEAAEAEADQAEEVTGTKAERAAEKIKYEAEDMAGDIKEEVEKVVGKVKEKGEEARDDFKQEDQGKSKGNAYGRNKGDLQGKEFGQARAEQARLQQQEKRAELDTTLVQGENKIMQAREKIRISREDLDKEKAGRRITDKEYQLKQEKLDYAEEAVNQLEKKIIEARRLKEEKGVTDL